ncbi:MAG TPA: hypothetical protein VK549_11225, partial [Acidimicrobiia bacterium]|nr:hypothetical protein [Acidimicrobiia bacterium]
MHRRGGGARSHHWSRRQPAPATTALSAGRQARPASRLRRQIHGRPLVGRTAADNEGVPGVALAVLGDD